MTGRKRAIDDVASGTPSERRSKQPRKEKKKPSLWIDQGNGGNYCFDLNDPDEIQYIGTTKCNTCVGVYWSVDEHMCFFAHINYQIRLMDGTLPSEETSTESDWEINEAAGFAIMKLVKELLVMFQYQGKWGPVNDRMRSSVKMICPMSGKEGKTYAGDAIGIAIRDFLGIYGSAGDVLPNNHHSGMLIRHTKDGNGKVDYIPPGVAEFEAWEEINADADVPEDERGDFACTGIRKDGALEGSDPPDDDQDETEEEVAEPEDEEMKDQDANIVATEEAKEDKIANWQPLQQERKYKYRWF